MAVFLRTLLLALVPVVVHGELVQPVRLTDAEGRAWLALYPMQRQPDGSWRTNGCQLARLAGTET